MEFCGVHFCQDEANLLFNGILPMWQQILLYVLSVVKKARSFVKGKCHG